MGLPLGTNFELNAEKFNFERDSFATLAEMKAFPLTSVPDGFTAFCEQDFNHYIMCKGCNPSEETGHWRNISTVTDFFDNSVDEFNYNRPVAYGPWREDRVAIVAALGDKVNKVDGKGLSTNDYTTTEKQKLAGLSNYNDSSVVKSIKINGETKTPTAGLVDLGSIGVGTAKIVITEPITSLNALPNVFYVLPELVSLQLTLATEDVDIASHYFIKFTSGATATTLSIPDTVKISGSIDANSFVEVSILDNIAYIKSTAL
ncbi:MAG: hypothetical protein ACRC6V_01360 [Bacteroidales bacterium]